MSLRLRASFVLLLGWIAASGSAQSDPMSDETTMPEPARYPLRLHVLAIDDTHRTVRMQPNWCGASVPDGTSADGGGCSSGSASLGGGSDDLSGAGRADLVTPPSDTVGLNFTYEGCPRVRVAPGFQGLEARWTRPGVRLEVMIPTDALSDGLLKTQRCTLNVMPQDFVYLRLRNGAIAKLSREAYLSKPSLRRFLSGGSQKLERRAASAAQNR